MLKKYLSNKTINLLEYYSTLNINNIFSNDITKSKHWSFANKEMLVSQLFKEINDQLNTKNNNNFFYKGNPDSQIMILGDFPNDDDVKNQEILSGSRGELLNKMLSSISLEKEKYYLSNIYFEKDIDIRNRNNFYKDILIKHLKIIKPKYILLLGEIVSNFFNNSKNKILDIHGKWDSIIINKDKFITFTTFDPEILLREPENKKLSWEDLKKFRNEIYKNL
ncbi:MAG: uracil-DNA glycosylase [Candidatus Fonsibacter sp.]|jgi:DNA polymerase|nr:uracil-DNA glycosylase [Candidatus Fonsibacter sp.]